MKILLLDSNHPLLHEELTRMGYECEPAYDWDVGKITGRIRSYDGIIIRSRIKLTKDLLEKAVQLKFIARVGAGMENIDVRYAESRGIKCLHAPEGNRDAVAEHAMGMLLALFNNLCKANHEVKEGKWLREANRGIELGGKTVGIIGYGNTGSAFARRLSSFEVSILVHDKYKKGFGNNAVKESSPEDLFEHADILSLHVPLTDETHYMVNDRFIHAFKKDIFIINTSRGQCIKTADLVKNLKNGKVRGACLDVLEYEDVSLEKLNLEPESFTLGLPKGRNAELDYLCSSDRVILSPHIAGWTQESKEKLARVMVKKIAELNLIT